MALLCAPGTYQPAVVSRLLAQLQVCWPRHPLTLNVLWQRSTYHRSGIACVMLPLNLLLVPCAASAIQPVRHLCHVPCACFPARLSTLHCCFRYVSRSCAAAGPAGPKPWDLIPKVNCPLFVAWGDTDPFTPIDGPVGK
jgi:pimeloyl-ACP methyl ester carboxylesterase